MAYFSYNTKQNDTTDLGRLYAFSENEEHLSSLIEKMCQDDHVRYQDALYLIGRIRDGKLLERTIDTWLTPVLLDTRFAVETAWIGDDVLTVNIPLIWLKDYPEHVGLRVLLPASDREYWAEDKFEIDTKAERVIFSVKGVINKVEFLEQERQTSMLIELITSAESVIFLIDASVQDVAVDKTIVDKSVDTSREVFNKTVDVVNVAKGLFSKDEGEQKKVPQPSEQQESELSIKTEQQIVFAIQKIETSNACYQLDDSTVERTVVCGLSE